MEYVAIIVFILIISVLLVCVVLVQNSKGGGLLSGLGSANQIAGVQKTTDFIEKLTWSLWGALVVLAVLATHFVGSKGGEANDEIDYQVENTSAAPAEEAPAFNGAEQE
ncbi:MAG: preprotein translocase subunit SecG [Bacteroidales bacterium]|nr:preprotein translocase subunit SecG [Candidatus Scybalocola fimicaballi]